jgi:NAD(P)-dependent dehydrogenase (short-subunit alcohol dehydrogenase family)
MNEKAARTAAEASKKWATNPAYRGLPCHVDITDLESLNRMIEFTIKEGGGRIDYAVNSAGVSIDFLYSISATQTAQLPFFPNGIPHIYIHLIISSILSP